MLVGLAAAAFLLIPTGQAAADPGDVFYLSKRPNTFVSFAVRAGSDEVSQLMYRATRIPCKGKRTPPKPQKMAKLDGSAPIVAGAFEDSWAASDPSYGGLKGTVDENGAAGKLRLKIHIRKKRKTDYTCDTGRRSWKADTVPERRWLAARARIFPGA